MDEDTRHAVRVVYATLDRQQIVEIDYRPGITAGQAVSASGLAEAAPEIAAQPLVLGIFGARVDPDRPLKPGDRVEICRPLKADPRDLRRAVAASGGVMGSAPDPLPPRGTRNSQ